MQKKGLFYGLLIIALAFSVMILGCQPEVSPEENGEQGEEAFALEDLKGQTVTLIVPHGEGGGYDSYARLIAPYIADYTGALVVIENISGGGGVVGRNEIWHANPDGFTIGFTAYAGLMMDAISEVEIAEYNADEFSFLGRVLGEPSVLCASAVYDIKSIEDLKNYDGEIRYGTSGVGDEKFYCGMIYGQVNGLNFKPVSGYAGTSEVLMGLIRGEFEINGLSLSSILPAIERGEVVPLAVNGLERDPHLPDIPTFIELAKNDEEREYFTVFGTIAANSRGFLAPPNIPEDVLKVWQDVIEAVCSNPKLISDGESMDLPIDFLHGEEVAKQIQETIALGEKVKPLIPQILELVQ